MSDNKREMMKITIEAPGRETQVIECDGIAGITAKDLEGNRHEMKCILAGSLSPVDLMAIHRCLKEELIPLIENSIKEHSAPSASDFLRMLADMFEEDN